MRTKTLLLAGLICAASAAASLAQTVYSVNAVGFVNVVSPPGFSLICNPLNASTNTVASLFPSPANGTSVFKFNPASGLFVGNTYFFGWSDTSMTVVPGEGFFYKNPTASSVTNTFVGNVQQGTLTTSLPAGYSITSSQVPQQGLVSTDLGLPIENGESVFTFANGSYSGSSYFFGWTGGVEPTIGVGQAFFVKRVTQTTWSRTFSANQ